MAIQDQLARIAGPGQFLQSILDPLGGLATQSLGNIFGVKNSGKASAPYTPSAILAKNNPDLKSIFSGLFKV